MRSKVILCLVVLVAAALACAREIANPQSGRLTQMDAVACGMEEKSGQGIMSELAGSDSNRRKTIALFCQEYVLESDKLVFRIRPREEKHAVILPVGDTVLFRMEKDHMLLRPAAGEEKEREYEVMSIKARESEPPLTPTKP